MAQPKFQIFRFSLDISYKRQMSSSSWISEIVLLIIFYPSGWHGGLSKPEPSYSIVIMIYSEFKLGTLKQPSLAWVFSLIPELNGCLGILRIKVHSRRVFWLGKEQSAMQAREFWELRFTLLKVIKVEKYWTRSYNSQSPKQEAN